MPAVARVDCNTQLQATQPFSSIKRCIMAPGLHLQSRGGGQVNSSPLPSPLSPSSPGRDVKSRVAVVVGAEPSTQITCSFNTFRVPTHLSSRVGWGTNVQLCRSMHSLTKYALASLAVLHVGSDTKLPHSPVGVPQSANSTPKTIACGCEHSKLKLLPGRLVTSAPEAPKVSHWAGNAINEVVVVVVVVVVIAFCVPNCITGFSNTRKPF